VLAKLKRNEADGEHPANVGQLRVVVGAKKGNLDALFDLERDPPQLSSIYVEKITKRLGVEPPFLEEDGDDDDFVRDARMLRTLTHAARQRLMLLAQDLPRRTDQR
jgi:hypothetical protein